jgi:hypothetical protein
MMDEGLPEATAWHSERRKWLKDRIARISACQSWRAVPFESGSLLAGRHFIPVLRRISGSVICLRRGPQVTYARDKHLREPSTRYIRWTCQC